MKRIAFIGHSYHKKTRSFDFFTEILKNLFSIDFFFDKTWAGDTPLNISAMGVSEYDVIILWQQIHYVLHPDIDKHTNVVFVPMFDCHAQNLNEFQRFIRNTNFKFINFCSAQHEACIQFGLKSLSVQYFPDPEEFDSKRNYEELIGFFWPRRKEITWDMVAKLISKDQISRMFFHSAPDRGFPRVMLPEKIRKKYQISISKWFDTREELFQLLERANVYFAPRLYEGIGLSFLEAMAMGMCVVAPDTPTMNEYITHGVNGLLYHPNRPAPLDFSEAKRLGARARESIEAGHKRWLKSIDNILDLIATESADLRWTQHQASEQESLSETSDPSTLRNLVLETKDAISLPQARLYGGLRTQGKVKKHTEEHPLITIATVTYNTEKELPGTLASILAQTYYNIELILVDGESTDGTMQIVKENEHFIDLWISEPDTGPYDAMNKAADLARGEWILFLNAGDWFTDNNIIEEVVKNSPRAADIIYGHHYYRHINGNMFWHKANAFEWTHEMLRKGQLTNEWVKGIPCHQTTLTRTLLLKKYGYDIERFSYASDHDFLFRMNTAGCVFHHTDLTIAVYCSSGFSWQNRADCMSEQWHIARKYGPRRLVDKFYRKRIRHVKKEQNRPHLSFSEEWHRQEVCFGGWMRWLPKTGDIKFQVEKPGECLVYFQACSVRPDNTLKVELNDQPLFHTRLSTRFSFFGPKQVTFEDKEHTFHFTSENEPSIPSPADPRLKGLAVKTFSVVEATSAARCRIYLSRLCSWFTAQTIGRLKSPLKATFLLTPHLLKTYAVIWKSGLFSGKYYRGQYPETLQKEIKNSLQHYIMQGASERKNPNPLFDTGYYLDRNPDVAAYGINPLYHYIVCGAREGREPSPHISVAEYLEQNPTLDPSKMYPLRHYLKTVKKRQLKAEHSTRPKNYQGDSACSSSAGNLMSPPQRAAKDDIQFQNREFVNEIRKSSNPSKVSFLQERGKILEDFRRDHYLGGVYEEIIKAFYTTYLQSGDVVVDCGAEVGHHTLPLANVVGPEGIVYAIDARPESTAQIKKKMGIFQRNILLYNCALSNWEGETAFTTVDGLPGWSSLVPYDKYPQEVRLRQRTVKVRRLDHIVDTAHEVKFIKLDIEGGEYHALVGSEGIISRHRPLLVFENGWLGAANRYNYLVKDFIDFFARHGFELFDILGEPFTPEFLITPHFVNNFIAVPDESAERYASLNIFLWKQALNHIPQLNALNSPYI